MSCCNAMQWNGNECNGMQCSNVGMYMYIYIYMGVSKPIIINVSGVNTHLPAILMFTRGTWF